MAMTEGSSPILTDQLRERIAVCDFCTEASRDCRLLPCLHVFCKNCLDDSQLTANDDADILMCPVCGQEYMQQPRLSDTFKMSKNLESHKNITDVSQSLSKKQSQELLDFTHNTDQREGNKLERPCGDCKEILCVSCLAADRKNSGVMETEKSSRNAIEQSISDVKISKDKALRKLEAIEAEKTEFVSRSEFLKAEIQKSREELKKLVDHHAESLVSELTLWEQESINATKGDIDTLCNYITSLDKYSTKCMEVLAKGSAKDLDGTVKNAEMLQLPRLKFEGQMNALHVNLQPTQLKELLIAYDSNIVGTLKDEEILEFEQKFAKYEELPSEEMLNFNDKTQFERLRQLHQKPSKTTSTGAFDYFAEPVFIRAMKTQPAAKDNRGILGITILNDELYVVSKDSSEVEVFDCKRLIFSCDFEVRDLVNPEDITSCSVLKCIYIMNCKTSRSTNKIIRIDKNGKLIRKWSTEADWGHLSVTPKANVLLSVYNRNKLMEYSPLGHVIRVMNFSVDEFDHIRHALKLTNDHYVVGHGEIGDSVQRVVLLDSNGNVTKTFSDDSMDNCNHSPMKRPFYIETVDDEKSILVADADNGRILLLDSNLELKRELLSSGSQGLRYPVRMCFDRANGRLYVVDNQVGNKRISVFDMK